MGKKEKYGSYLCKVGYFDIRQKIVMPRIKKNNRGEAMSLKGSTEVFVYQGKHQITGPFKSQKLATKSANELLEKKYKFNKFEK